MIVWAMTADGTCTLSAGKSLAQFGFSPGELVGQNMFEIYADNSASLEEFRRVLAGQSFKTQQTLAGVTWSTSYHSAIDGQGLVTGMFAISEDISVRAQNEQRILEQLALIQSQKQAIDRLVSPIIEVWGGVLVVPLFGDVGEERAAIVTERLLDGVVRHRARFAILDLTGIELVDTSTAQRLFNIMRGVDLLGCTTLISGIQPNVAMTMVTLGVNIPAGRTYSTLADALQRCVRASILQSS
jgi:anti-anti-sigma regulatory factor